MRAIFSIVSVVLVLPALASGQEAEPVEVVNFPEVQAIEGQVGVDGPIAQTRLVSLSDAIVPPVDPGETTDLHRPR